MIIVVRNPGNEKHGIASFLRRALERSLGRFSENVRHVAARISDVNGPRGGIDKLCAIRITVTRRGSPIVVEHQASRGPAAVVMAVHRAQFAVARAIGRGRKL